MRVRVICRGVSAALVLLAAAGVPAAAASTVTVRPDRTFHSFNEVFYAADASERNDVVVAYAADALSVTVTDPGAVIRATGSCTSVDPHSAVCRAPDPGFPIAGPFVQHARVELGDLDDSVVTTRPGPFVIGGVDADGGPGDDRLIGSATDDRLDGGGGRDELRGNGGSDRLTDGDLDGAAPGQGPGPDILDGGPGSDELSYARRSRPVRVDLEHPARDGAPGEGDAVSGIESVRGGRGDDRLLGDGAANALDGGGGRDRLVGRAGADTLRRPSGSSVSCGAGRDTVRSPRATTLIAADCESLLFALPRSTLSDDESTALTPTPQRRAGRRGFDIRCPEIDGEPLACSAHVVIRERATHRLLAAGRLARAGRTQRFLRLAVTARGRRLLRAPGVVRATSALSGALLPTARWTTHW